MTSRYQVLFRPLESTGVYMATPVDVTPYISSMANINVDIEGDEFTFGLFKYNNVQLVLNNASGYFKYFFPLTRDKTKVEVYFIHNAITSLHFSGLINDISTSETEDTIAIQVLGIESSLSFLPVKAGLIRGDDALTAIKLILSDSGLINFFRYDATNISVHNNPTIDNGAALDGIPKLDALKELLLASNSVLYIKNGDVIVSSRHNLATPTHDFKYASLFADNNILRIIKANNGLSRLFNIVKLSDTVLVADDDSILQYGAKKIELELKSIQNVNTLTAIATSIRDEFKILKKEIDIEVATENITNPAISLFNQCTINIKEKLIPPANTKLAFYDDGSLWNSGSSYPLIKGTITQSHDIAYKVIGKFENTKSFKTVLRLREKGVLINDSGI